jgi:hypothetical protein
MSTIKPVNPARLQQTVGADRTTNKALVVSIDDPLKQGRVKIRVIGHMDNEIDVPDEKLPWVKPILGPESSSLQTAAVSHRYMPGSMVTCEKMGEDWTINGSIPNDNEQQQSLPPAYQGHEASDKVWDIMQMSTIQKGDGSHGLGRPLGDIYKIKTTKEARQLRDQAGKLAKRTKETVEHSINGVPTPGRYNYRTAAKDPDGGTIGGVLSGGADAQQFIKDTIQNKSAVVPNMLDAMQNLKKVSGNPTSINSIGAGNFQQIIGQLQQLFKKNKGAQPEQKRFDCEWLIKQDPSALEPDLRERRRVCLLVEEQIINGETDPDAGIV